VWIYPFRVSTEFSRFSWEPAVYKKDSDREDQLRRKGPATIRSVPVYVVCLCVCVCVYTFKLGCLINHYLILGSLVVSAAAAVAAAYATPTLHPFRILHPRSTVNNVDVLNPPQTYCAHQIWYTYTRGR